MKAAGKHIIETLLLIAGFALVWGGFGQVTPDSYYLYLAGSILLIDSAGLFINASWIRTLWWITIAGAAIFAIYYDTLPLRHGYYSSISLRDFPMFIKGTAPFIFAMAVAYVLPKLESPKSK